MRFEISTCDNSGSLNNIELVDLGTDNFRLERKPTEMQ